MASTTLHPTPQERLAASRKAIVRHMAQDERDAREEHDQVNAEDADFEARGGGTWQVVKHAVKAWWRHHPAHMAVDLAKPVLGRYAEEQPLKLLGIAAAIGAATVVIKPWRLVSMTGLLLATLKSSEVSGVLLSLLSTHHNSGDTTANQDTP